MEHRVIKENDLFLVTDEKGNIPENHEYGLGLYTQDTRFLSKFDLKVFDENPILLSSKADQNYETSILLTNPEIKHNGATLLNKESLEFKRHRFIYQGIFYESLIMKNYNPEPVTFDINVAFDVDFSDMFIVRGFQTGKTGEMTGTQSTDKSLSFHYLGRDDIRRTTQINWDTEAKQVTQNGEVTFNVDLAHLEEKTITIQVIPGVGDEVPNVVGKTEALKALQDSYKDWEQQTTTVETDHKPFQRLIDRGVADLRVLVTDLGYGPFPVAGIPWYSVPFGRDSLIAAMQMLPFNPQVAKGTLRTLAAFQGKEIDEWREEQPGKIMHEMRFGELAKTNQSPFTPYYGTADATPLFLILLSDYIKWTNDWELFDQLSENVDAALHWIDNYGDRDGDGFVEYHQESEKGIPNQGWKDSDTALVHRNGKLAKSPIALSEVQGYVYQAKNALADIYENRSEIVKATSLRDQANDLKVNFDNRYWMAEHEYIAIALEKDKEQVGTLTSNPGHVLLSGLLDEPKATKVSKKLVSRDLFSGYGIRTMGDQESAYNPVSYHNGSVWPHDNSLIVLGMSKMGHHKEANQVMEGLVNASTAFEYDRLPELFCGYSQEPVKYPSACSPQAWAAGTPLLFIQALLGLFPNGIKKTITISPSLLTDMNVMKISEMSIGEGHLDLTVYREGNDIKVNVDKNTTGFEIELN